MPRLLTKPWLALSWLALPVTRLTERKLLPVPRRTEPGLVLAGLVVAALTERGRLRSCLVRGRPGI
jgi:hypothetical protein